MVEGIVSSLPLILTCFKNSGFKVLPSNLTCLQKPAFNSGLPSKVCLWKFTFEYLPSKWYFGSAFLVSPCDWLSILLDGTLRISSGRLAFDSVDRLCLPLEDLEIPAETCWDLYLESSILISTSNPAACDSRSVQGNLSTSLPYLDSYTALPSRKRNRRTGRKWSKWLNSLPAVQGWFGNVPSPWPSSSVTLKGSESWMWDNSSSKVQ